MLLVRMINPPCESGFQAISNTSAAAASTDTSNCTVNNTSGQANPLCNSVNQFFGLLTKLWVSPDTIAPVVECQMAPWPWPSPERENRTGAGITLLRGPNTLTPAEREMIATYVSPRNDCYYCQTSHGSTAAQHLGGGSADYELIGQMKRDSETAPLSDKMKALLAIAGKVRKGGKYVTTDDVERARNHGATDKEIHDTVLIAAVFCMANRYVDGLETWQPHDPDLYREIGRQTVALGYVGRDWKRPLPKAASE
jgi:uncharacterized peroxidase-related enzyme